MKHLLATLLTTMTLLLAVLVPAASAQFTGPIDEVCRDTPDAVACQSQSEGQDPLSGTNGVIVKAARLIAFIVGIASVIMIIVGGIRYILSSGDSNNVTAAKNMIIYSIVGLVVAILAQSIIVFVINRI